MATTLAEFKTAEKSWWCPGCGDFGVLAAMQRALVEMDLNPEMVTIVAGIGCSGRIGNYINSYNFHTVHGRTLPTAMGVKLANRDLTVLAAGGDGDGLAIGMSHFMHMMRRNIDITYVLMDNHIYGLTKGQVSPASDPGFVTKSTPAGNIEHPVRPLELALAAGAGFVAQGFSSNLQQLAELIKQAVQHRGFSFVNAISPCVTFNKVNTYDFYKEGLTNVDEDPNYDATDRSRAFAKVVETESMITGLIYREERPSYEDLAAGFMKAAPVANQDLNLSPEKFEKLLAQFR
mgnify:CR=1 FL=1